jgi:hypothetical protein
MRKHILGFAIFSLIVGTAVFVSALVYKKVQKQYVYEVSERSCWKQVRQTPINNPNSVKISQAVFNADTKQLYLEFSTPDARTFDVKVTYTSIKNSKGGYLYQYSKNVEINPNNDFKASQSIILPEFNTNKMQPADTMYVSIENNFESNKVVNLKPFPVLIIQK